MAASTTWHQCVGNLRHVCGTLCAKTLIAYTTKRICRKLAAYKYQTFSNCVPEVLDLGKGTKHLYMSRWVTLTLQIFTSIIRKSSSAILWFSAISKEFNYIFPSINFKWKSVLIDVSLIWKCCFFLAKTKPYFEAFGENKMTNKNSSS